MRTLSLVALAATACAASAHAMELQLRVGDDGSFSITHDGNPWVAGSEVQVSGLSKADGTLVLKGGAVESASADALGKYKSTKFQWTAASDSRGNVLMETAFRTYPGDTGVVVFEQHFPSQLDRDHTPSNHHLSARTIFPAFARGAAAGNASRELDAFAYHEVFPSVKATSLGKYKESHQGGAPLALYDSKNASLPMTVFAPLNFPKAHHMASSDAFVGAGLKATAEVVPAGHSQLFILSAGQGINDGFMAWGDRVLKVTGKPRADMYCDQTHSTIGFWTDNGGYYHYATGVANDTYEDVLPKVKAYHDSIGVPFGHWQFDSWFYPKDGGVNPGGGGGAVTNWTAMDGSNGPFVFPSMQKIQEQLSKNTSAGFMPTVMHNRQWSPESDYIHNWTDIEWYKSEKAAIPHDPAAFFERFFTQQEGWGLTMYEQDWMNHEYDSVTALQTNLTLADLWLEGMASGATGSDLTVQYCMPYPNDVLAAQAHTAVTNARATGDYFHANQQWAVGNTALFYWAIGILPFKDGFYSSTNKQVGGQTVGPEGNPDREALMATLSGAMVGPMDGINLLNASRVMTTCRADGVVLKPDRPVTVSDWCFLRADPSCRVYATYSNVPGLGRVAYFFDDNAGSGVGGVFESAMVDVPSRDVGYVVYNWYDGTAVVMQPSQSVRAGYEGHTYLMIVPVTGGDDNTPTEWALLGEISKYVPLSTKRFVKVNSEADAITVTLRGVPGEVVTWCALLLTHNVPDATSTRRSCSDATFPSGGSGEVIMKDTIKA